MVSFWADFKLFLGYSFFISFIKNVILLFIFISYISSVLVVFCAGSDASDSELDEEELRKMEEIYRQHTGFLRLLVPEWSFHPKLCLNRLPLSHRINQYYEKKFLLHFK